MKQLPLVLAAALAAAAQAHVTLEYQIAPAASHYKASFRVGHGCGSSPTRQLVVQVPDAMRNIKPMPKPGWTLEVERGAVTRVTWTARSRADMLPADQYDEFVLVARTPAGPGTVYWPVTQLCEEGRHDWTEVPRPGQPLTELKSPAAALEIMPSGAASAHHHH